VKDLVGLILVLMLYIYFISFKPDALGHSDNYIPASSLVTPEHIVPEWYFLPFYAILRSIPNKLGGVLLMALSIVLLALLPYILRFLLIFFYGFSFPNWSSWVYEQWIYSKPAGLN